MLNHKLTQAPRRPGAKADDHREDRRRDEGDEERPHGPRGDVDARSRFVGERDMEHDR